ncbi:MAG TPA: HAD-IIIA family hydrolase [Longimicrobiales bacterium]|nr:HAD-IIIA family hydrolase [Longimicrobiales bacterium]
MPGTRGDGARAVFLDRDGVLNAVVLRDGRPASPRTPDELVVEAGAAAAVRRLRECGYLVFAVTNQPDVARGLLTEAALAELMSRVEAEIPLDDWRSCIHDDVDGCECRKPRPGMVQGLARVWGVDLAASYLVGDSWKDMEAGRAAGCRTILLRRDYNSEARGGQEVGTLDEAVDIILAADRPTHALRFLAESRWILERLDPAAIEAMAAALAELRERGGRLFFLGVGGGAGHASHAVNDFRKIAGIESYAATDNVAELTARANDEGWESTFVEYLRGSRLRREDGVFVFSVGGGSLERGISTNLVRAVAYAAEVGASVFGVVGRDGGFTARVARHCIVVPTANPETVTPHTETFQALVWHLLVSHPKLQRGAMKWESVEAAR